MNFNKTVAIHTLGCKVNAYESEVIMGKMKEAGFIEVGFDEKADIYIINTCSVTNIADRKSRQMLHRAKKKNPDAYVVAIGCYVQSVGDSLLEDESVDMIIGTKGKNDIVDIICKHFENESCKESYIQDISKSMDFEDMLLTDTGEKTRAYMKIQDGCNQFCSYCIIPYVRGRIRSRSYESIKQEALLLAQKGYKEIVLTGIHITSYGKDLKKQYYLEHDAENGGIDYKSVEEGDLKDDSKTELIDIIEMIDKIEGIERIRLSSLEPRIITNEFVLRLKNCKKVCPHFHLSLQSGCDETLKRMNRNYTTDDFEKGVEIIRSHYENPAVSTDVIVGFPKESDEEFEATCAFLEKIKLSKMHIFKYSRRKGTRADKMDGQINENIKTVRSERLLKLEEECEKNFEEKHIGREEEVLFEECIRNEEGNFYCGYTKEYIKVFLKTDENLKNKILRVKLHSYIKETYENTQFSKKYGENILATNL